MENTLLTKDEMDFILALIKENKNKELLIEDSNNPNPESIEEKFLNIYYIKAINMQISTGDK